MLNAGEVTNQQTKHRSNGKIDDERQFKRQMIFAWIKWLYWLNTLQTNKPRAANPNDLTVMCVCVCVLNKLHKGQTCVWHGEKDFSNQTTKRNWTKRRKNLVTTKERGENSIEKSIEYWRNYKNVRHSHCACRKRERGGKILLVTQYNIWQTKQKMKSLLLLLLSSIQALGQSVQTKQTRRLFGFVRNDWRNTKYFSQYTIHNTSF